MKQADAETAGRRAFPSWASGVASLGATATLLLLMGTGAKAETETFKLSGEIGKFLGPEVTFGGSFKLDFASGFSSYEVQSIDINVPGRKSDFTLNPSVALSSSTTGTIQVYNNADDMLTLLFNLSSAGAWTNFTTGDIFFGDVVFGGNTGSLLGAEGLITRTSGPIISTPPPDPPTATAPELSTWTMMLIGLAGLGLAARGRRALAFLGGRA